MTRQQLEEKGYRFHITPFGWRVEWNLPLDAMGSAGDDILEGNEEAIPTGLDLRREFHRQMNGAMDDVERDAIEQANVDWVTRRIRK